MKIYSAIPSFLLIKALYWLQEREFRRYLSSKGQLRDQRACEMMSRKSWWMSRRGWDHSLSRVISLLLVSMWLLGQHGGRGLISRGLLYGWLPRRWICGVPASTLAAVLATVLAAIRGELRDLWDPAGEHRLHTHNHPLPSEQTPNLNLFYFCFFFFLSFCAFACVLVFPTSWSLVTSDRMP